jgi:hypothetical protein
MLGQRTKDLRVIDRTLNLFSRDDPGFQRTNSALLRARRALRRMLTDLEWNLYLVVDERVSAAHGALLDQAIRVALSQGQRTKFAKSSSLASARKRTGSRSRPSR